MKLFNNIQKTIDMKLNKWILYTGSILPLIFTACSPDATEIVEGKQQEPVEIRMSTGIISEASPVTRGAGMIDKTLNADLNVYFARADKSGDTPAYPTKYDATTLIGTVAHATTGNPLSFNPKAYYLANGESCKIIGWYPQSGTYSESAKNVTFSAIDGSTDIMVTKLKEGNKTAQVSTITFEHVLTQISVQAYAADAAAKNIWGGIKSIKIKGKKQSCVITLPDPSTANAEANATVTFNGTDDLNLVKNDPANNTEIMQNASAYGDSNPLELGVKDAGGNNAVLAGYAMFAPVPAAADAKITLEIVMEKGASSETKAITLATGYLKSNSYVITLKFTSTEIVPKVAIEEWKAGTAPGEVII